MSVTPDDIRAAQQRIRGAVYRSPCPFSLALSRLCGCDVFCKLDHLQITGSFKERGARNRLRLLSDAERSAGVVAASAGNHALGLAYHGQQLGIPVTVVMPRWAPIVKVSTCRSFAARVILHGASFDEARAHASRLAETEMLTYIHGFDDPDIIAGQGTMGLEMLEDVPDLDAVIVPVGGGGLIAGVGLAIKSMRPQVRVIGVEPLAAPSLRESLRAGRVVRVPVKPTIADGLAIAEMGKLCFELARQVVDEVVLVDEPQIAQAVLRLMELEKAVVEGAAATSLSAALQLAPQLAGKKVVLALCGGNIDLTLVSRIIEHGLAADGRLWRISARISDRPGGLAQIAAVLAAAGASIKQVEHDRSFGSPDPWTVTTIFTLETRDREHVAEIEKALRAEAVDFSEAL
jgi:threonine dehydratase